MGDLKSQWHLVDDILLRRTKANKHHIVQLISPNDTSITNPIEIANELNKFFVQITHDLKFILSILL